MQRAHKEQREPKGLRAQPARLGHKEPKEPKEPKAIKDGRD